MKIVNFFIKSKYIIQITNNIINVYTSLLKWLIVIQSMLIIISI